MGKLNALDLKDDAGAADLPDEGEIPEQRGELAPNPLPGLWGFRLPQNLDELWEVMEANDPRSPKADDPKDQKKVQRVRIVFDQNDSPLEVVLPVKGDQNYGVGAGIGGKINNLERRRGKKDQEDAPFVSDMYYFLEALHHDMDALRAELKKTPKKANVIWGNAVNQHAGELIKIKITWTAGCRADAIRYVWETNDEGQITGSVEDPDKGTGCGWRGYMKDIPKDENGNLMERFTCPKCEEAVVRAFPQFDQYKSFPAEQVGQEEAAQ